MVDIFQGKFWDSVEKSSRGIELARLANDKEAELEHQYWCGGTRPLVGDAQQATLNLEHMLVLAEEFQHSFWLTTVSWSMAQAATCLGDWESARQHSERGLELFPNDCRNLAVRMQVAAELGEFNQGKRYMENLVSSVRMSPRGPTFEYMVAALGIPLFDRIAGGADQLDAAQDAADAILSGDNSSTVLRWGAMAGSALSSIREGDRSASADRYKFYYQDGER